VLPSRRTTDSNHGEPIAPNHVAREFEIFYNGKRRHSTIDYLSPVEFERRYYEKLKAPRAA